jgi:glycosyltransferase involved in cell wall biosynthesis
VEQLVYGRIFRLSKILIAHSKYVRDGLISEFGIEPAKIVEVPLGNMSHLLAFRKSRHENSNQAGSLPVVLFFGQIRENKGLDIMIEALPLVVGKIPNVKLQVVGFPVVNMKSYYDMARSLGIMSHIDFRLGYVEENEIPAYFESASVVALPYKTIGQSGVAVAACTFGKAIVATRCGGLVELVEEAKNGILVPVGDSASLAEAISKILLDGGLRKTYEKNSRVYAETQLSWSLIADKTIELYKEVTDFSEEAHLKV